MSEAKEDKPVRTIEDAIGGIPSEAFYAAWNALHECTLKELAYFRLDGLRAIQLSRVVMSSEK